MYLNIFATLSHYKYVILKVRYSPKETIELQIVYLQEIPAYWPHKENVGWRLLNNIFFNLSIYSVSQVQTVLPEVRPWQYGRRRGPVSTWSVDGATDGSHQVAVVWRTRYCARGFGCWFSWMGEFLILRGFSCRNIFVILITRHKIL